MSIASNDLKRLLGKTTNTNTNKSRLAKVVGMDERGVFIKFFGDETESQKPYKRLASYTPAIGDVVFMVNVNNSYVVAGKVV